MKKNLTLLFVFSLLSLVLLSSLSCSSLTSISSIKGEQEKKRYFRSLWTKNFDDHPKALEQDTGHFMVAFQSPLLLDQVVFVGTSYNEMMALNAKDGREVWKVNEATAIVNTPTIHQELLIYGTAEGRLIARQVQTGALRYAVDLGDAVESSAAIDKEGRLYVHLRNHKVIALDALSGKILWNYARSITHKTTLQQVSTPLLYKGSIIVGCADGFVVSLTKEEGVVQWERQVSQATKFVDVDMTPVLKGDLLYVASVAGPLTILNPDSGVILRRFDYKVYRAPHFLAADAGMIIGTDEGELLHLDRYGAVVKRAKLSSSILNISEWADALLVATRDGELYTVDSKEFKLLDQFHFGTKNSLLFGVPSISGKSVALLSSRNRLYLFKTN
ncbi:MAG: PQQ-binding-like beta-propeller repeat protein [Oligoflexia bacterium]|nr:PQQ-binding-like beta-propeller repeat protein [Oligoflexia bacterium]